MPKYQIEAKDFVDQSWSHELAGAYGRGSHKTLKGNTATMILTELLFDTL